MRCFHSKHSYSGDCNSFLPSQQFPRILGTSKIHYSIYNSPPVVPVLNQTNPAQFLQDPSRSRSSKRFLPSGFQYALCTQALTIARFAGVYVLRKRPPQPPCFVHFRCTWFIPTTYNSFMTAITALCTGGLHVSGYKVNTEIILSPPAQITKCRLASFPMSA